MPILKNAKTVWVDDDAWTSPDGKVTIWNIKLEVDGERELQRTMSKVIAKEGFEGDVEIYTNDKGKDYVRQAPKEEGSSATGSKSEYVDHSKDITLGLVYKTVANIRGLPENAADSSVFWEMVKEHTEELINISEKLNTGSQSSSPQVPTPSGTAKERQQEKAQPARDYVSEEQIPEEFR